MQFTVHRAPLILSLHLKRFESSWGGKASKINKHVKFEPVLSIKSYMSESEKGGGQCTQYRPFPTAHIRQSRPDGTYDGSCETVHTRFRGTDGTSEV